MTLTFLTDTMAFECPIIYLPVSMTLTRFQTPDQVWMGTRRKKSIKPEYITMQSLKYFTWTGVDNPPTQLRSWLWPGKALTVTPSHTTLMGVNPFTPNVPYSGRITGFVSLLSLIVILASC